MASVSSRHRSSEVNAFITMVGLTLVDGVFLSILLTHRLSSWSAAAGIGVTIFSGAGALTTGHRLPGNLSRQLATASAIYCGVGLIAILFSLLSHVMASILPTSSDLRALAAVLLAQLGLVLAGVVPGDLTGEKRGVGTFHHLILLARHYQLTAGLLFLLVGLRFFEAFATFLRPYLLPALFSPSDLALLVTLVVAEISLSRLPAFRARFPDCTVPKDQGETRVLYTLRLMLDYRLILLVVSFIYGIRLASCMAQGMVRTHVMVTGLSLGVVPMVAVAIASAWLFTVLGITALWWGRRWFDGRILAYAGGASLWCIGAGELGAPLPSWTTLSVLCAGLTASVMFQAAWPLTKSLLRR